MCEPVIVFYWIMSPIIPYTISLMAIIKKKYISIKKDSKLVSGRNEKSKDCINFGSSTRLLCV